MALATVALTTNTTNLYPASVGLILVTATLSATAYATASGGVLLDISSILTQLSGIGSNQMSGANTEYRVSTQAINWADVYCGIAIANITTNSGGGNTNGVAVLTKTATSGQFTMRLFLTATGVENADGNLTGTVQLFIFIDRGSRSYNA